jgi:hypothetical protein
LTHTSGQSMTSTSPTPESESMFFTSPASISYRPPLPTLLQSGGFPWNDRERWKMVFQHIFGGFISVVRTWRSPGIIVCWARWSKAGIYIWFLLNCNTLISLARFKIFFSSDQYRVTKFTFQSILYHLENSHFGLYSHTWI